MAKITFDVESLTRVGAEVRIKELQAQTEEVRKAVPHLCIQSNRPTAGSAPVIMGTKPSKSRRRRRQMTAAQRAEVSRRMKAYWAGRRKAKKG